MHYILNILLDVLLCIIYIGQCQIVEPDNQIDIDKFVQHTWYAQYQQIVSYQNEDELYCVAATYNIEQNRTVPFFDGTIISVYNYANKNKVNGIPVNTKDGMVICARIPDEKKPGKLVVAPCNLPNLFGGNYWIIGVGKNYEWLVVSGGQPRVKYDDGCTTYLNRTLNSGLWIFSKYRIMPLEDLNTTMSLLQEKGFTLSKLIKVDQKGCVYDKAFIKHSDSPSIF